MRAIIQSLRRDHADIEELLCILERECDLFQRAVRPDYDMLGEIIGYFQLSLDQYHHPNEDLVLNLTGARNAECARIVSDVTTERALAASSLQDLGDAFRDILNEQRVLRRAFDEAARSFIQHERRKIEIEEQQLFPAALSVLAPADWAALNTRLRAEKALPHRGRLEERLRDQHRRIVAEALADRAERRVPGDAVDT